MNPETAANSKKISVENVDFRDLPGQSNLFLDFLSSDHSEIDRFFPNRSRPLKDFSSEVLERYQTDRNTLCNALAVENQVYGAGDETARNIERLRQADCVAVLTGQQAGLFSGPAYTVYKALSTIKIADSLKKAGVNAVPVFWIASEDHDFDEISVAHFRDKDRELRSVRISPNESFAGFPVGNIPIGKEIAGLVDLFVSELEHSGFTDALKNEILETYWAGNSLSASFGALLTKWLGKYGLIFTNPLNPVIRTLSAPIFAKAIDMRAKIRTGLLDANERLRAGGYHVQVDVEEGYLPLFYFAETGVRTALREKSGTVRAKDGSFECSIGDLESMVSERPDSFSPNALFRPVVQDFVFPTVCYIGGAAEIAYFAQNESIYKLLQRPVTPIRHRAAVTILDARHRRTLEAFDLSVSDLWTGYEAGLKRIITKHAEPQTRQLFLDTRERMLKMLDDVSSELSRLDPGLSANFEKRQKKIIWHLDAMEEKYLRFETRRNGDLVRRLRDLFDSGYPINGFQERTICFADHVNRYGPALFDWMYANIDETGKKHRVMVF